MSSASMEQTEDGGSHEDENEHNESADFLLNFSETVTIVVGDGDPMIVHTFALKRVPFFEHLLTKFGKEGRISTIPLSKDNPRAFNLILRFLYMDKIPALDQRIAEGFIPEFKDCAHAFVLADKYRLESLQNGILDAFMHFYDNGLWFNLDTIDILQDTGLQNSSLLRFLVQMLAFSIDKHQWSGAVMHIPGLEDWVRSGGYAVGELVQLLAKPGSTSPPINDNRCDWHSHKCTPKCPKK